MGQIGAQSYLLAGASDFFNGLYFVSLSPTIVSGAAGADFHAARSTASAC